MGDRLKMAVSNLARRVRCDDVLSYFIEKGNRNTFITLTTPDVVTIHQIRERWRSLRHYLVELYGRDLKYVMNYELHPNGHGWHIHAVFNRCINLRNGGLYKIRSYGFGMVNVRLVNSKGVSQYLSKHCLKAYRGVQKGLKGDSKRLRLVNTSRGLPRLSDYKWQSAFNEKIRAYMASNSFQNHFKSLPFQRRYDYATYGVLNGWTVPILIGSFSRRLQLSNLSRDHLNDHPPEPQKKAALA